MSDAPCSFLPWDTNFFGKRIARVNGPVLASERLPVIDAWCAAEQIDCLYFLADSTDALTVRLAEENGFRLQDIRLTLALTKPAPGRETLPELSDTPVNIRASRPDDLEKLHDTARHAYVHTRFYNDPHFTREQCAALYDTWLTRSINERAYADITFIADVDNMPAGYVACHLNYDTRTGVIGLVGVAETARGQSMGQKLVLHALEWFWQQGMAEVQVTTQGRNIAGQRLYQRCGFLTQSMLLWYHRWSADTK